MTLQQVGWTFVLLGLAACQHVVSPIPDDWKSGRPATAALPAVSIPEDPQEADDALRKLIKPPALCFPDPAVCGLAAQAMSLAVLRPEPAHLDALKAGYEKHAAVWPVETRWLHCESLCAWDAGAGKACLNGLLEGGKENDAATRVRALSLMDVLGPEGNALAQQWLQHTNVEVRRDAAEWWSLRAWQSPDAAMLGNALNLEPDEATAVHLIHAFSTLRTPAVVSLLDRMARSSPQMLVRIAALDVMVDLVGPSIRARLLTIPAKEPEMQAAIDRNLRLLNSWQDGSVDRFQLPGGLDFLSMANPAKAGGVAFMDDFKATRERNVQWAVGEKLSAEEIDRLLRQLEDAGGYGLTPVGSSMAVSLGMEHLGRLEAIRRAVFVSGAPNQDALLRTLAQVVRVIRQHYVMQAPTRYWRKQPANVSGEPLRFHP